MTYDMYDLEIVNDIKNELAKMKDDEIKEVFSQRVKRLGDKFKIKNKVCGLSLCAGYIFELIKSKTFRDTSSDISKKTRAIELLNEAKQHVEEANDYLTEYSTSKEIDYNISTYAIDSLLDNINTSITAIEDDLLDSNNDDENEDEDEDEDSSNNNDEKDEDEYPGEIVGSKFIIVDRYSDSVWNGSEFVDDESEAEIFTKEEIDNYDLPRGGKIVEIE
jgi:hypothetical protein